MIIFPVIMLVILNFAFGAFDNTVSPIIQQQFLLNCPWPLQNQNIVTVMAIQQITISGTTVIYNATQPGTSTTNSTGTGTFFYCYIAANQPAPALAVIATQRNYQQTIAAFPVGWFQYVGDTLGSFFGKAAPLFTLLYLYINLPAVVTGIVWFSLVDGILLLMIGIGGYILIRSGGLG